MPGTSYFPAPVPPASAAATSVSRMQSAGNAPTLTVQANAGTGASATCAAGSNNVAGKITFVSGTGLNLTAGKVLRLSLADGVSYPNGCSITFSAANGNFAGLIGNLYVVEGTSWVDLYVTIALAAGASYIGFYNIIGY